MNIEEIILNLNDAQRRISALERERIQLTLDPVVQRYLDKAVGKQIYAENKTPVGVVPVGSLWINNTGVLATSTIHVYSPTGWVQIK